MFEYWKYVNEDEAFPRTYVKAEHKELVLALAAMTTSTEEFIVGEWLYCHTDLVMNGSKKIRAITEKLYKSDVKSCFTDEGMDIYYMGGPSGWKTWFRKPTTEELIEHFTLPSFVLPARWYVLWKGREDTKETNKYFDKEYNYFFNGGVSSEEQYIGSGYTESERSGYGTPITMEQFRKYVAKTTPMSATTTKDKKIIGYRVIKAFPGAKVGNEFLWEEEPAPGYHSGEWFFEKEDIKEAPEFWEPIYEEEGFKVGDWVVVTKSGGGTSMPDVGLVAKIASTKLSAFSLNSLYTITLDRIKSGNKDRFVHPGVLREATPSEIEGANRVAIAGYGGDFS